MCISLLMLGCPIQHPSSNNLPLYERQFWGVTLGGEWLQGLEGVSLFQQ